MDAIVEKAWERISEALADNFRLRRSDGTFVHYDTTSSAVTRAINNSITYEALAATCPRFRRRRCLCSGVCGETEGIGTETRGRDGLISGPTVFVDVVLKESSIRGSGVARESVQQKCRGDGGHGGGTLHTLGRDVFYYNADSPKDVGREPGARKEWASALKSER